MRKLGAAQKCCVHLPGNRECPYAPLYEVTWKPHRLRPANAITRSTCVFHLAEAINGALSDSARDSAVKVKILPQEIA